MSDAPEIKEDYMYRLIRDGKIRDFNAERKRGVKPDLRSADFRHVNLQGIDFSGLDLSNAYFRQADLRGVDLRACNLEGASIHGAKISGVYFPSELDADEITLSLLHGTRMRYRSAL